MWKVRSRKIEKMMIIELDMRGEREKEIIAKKWNSRQKCKWETGNAQQEERYWERCWWRRKKKNLKICVRENEKMRRKKNFTRCVFQMTFNAQNTREILEL